MEFSDPGDSLFGGYTPKDAIDLIRAGRSPNALCNKDFVAYLKSLCEKKDEKRI